MSASVSIALDAAGGDHGPQVVVPAATRIAARFPDVRLILVGRETVLRQHLQDAGAGGHDRIRIQDASEVVGMDESPAQALRGKKDSSMRVAINLVRDGAAQACVSAGNTGALMATARFVLKTLPGIDRPAIITSIPSLDGHTWVLDLGANVDCTAEHLLQFAAMGSVLAAAVDGNPAPRVALMNIGEEDIKGNEQVQEAAALLSRSTLNYTGFVEGDDVYLGGTDVVVCDGFVGNVALKTSEGVARMISQFLREGFSKNLLSRLAGLAALPVLKGFKQRIDPRRYNGATLVGLQGVVVKSHGSADAFAFANAIEVAIVEAEQGVPERIRHQLEDLLVERQAS